MGADYVHCFARGVPGQWEGICPDLDIAVQGTSFEDVKSKLHDALESYVEDACKEPPEVAHRLLMRRAPLHVRLRIAASYLMHIVRGSGDRNLQAGFDLACHA